MESKEEEAVDARQSSTEWGCVNGGDLALPGGCRLKMWGKTTQGGKS